MLLRFLQNVSSAMVSDVLVQELVIKVLCCCQDIVKPFLSSLTVTYEPRLSLAWVSNVNLLTKVRNISTRIYYGTSNIVFTSSLLGAILFSDLYGIATAFKNDRENHFEDFCTSDAFINKCGHTAWNQPNSTKSWSSGKLVQTLRNLKKWT